MKTLINHSLVNVTREGPTYLLGQTAHPDNYTLNSVNIVWAAVAGTRDNTYTRP